METVIATILSISGEAWARGENGDLRRLESGDQLLAGEVLVTAPNAQVQLDFDDGAPPVAIAGGQEIAMAPELAQVQDGDSNQTDDSSALDQDVQDIIAALNSDDGEQTVEGRQVAPAAGNEADTGDAGGGISFVKLTRITSHVNPLQYDFPLPDQTGIDVRLVGADGGANADASVDDGTPPTDGEPPVEPPTEPPVEPPTEPPVEPPQATPTISTDDIRIQEGDSGKFTVDVTGAGVGSTVELALQDGTAVSSGPHPDYDPDFQYSTDGGTTWTNYTGAFTIDPGDQQILVRTDTHDDNIAEPDETYTLDATLTSNGTDYNDPGTATIIDDEPGVADISFNPDAAGNPPPPVTEGGNLGYKVILDSATNGDTIYTFHLGGGSADSSDYDYGSVSFNNGVVDNGDGTITVPGGVEDFLVTVPTIDDGVIEGDETLDLTVGGVTAAGTIADNDGTPGNDVLQGSIGADVLAGGPGDDTIHGGYSGSTGNNELHGGTGDDELIGAAGDDLLVGGPGDDTLTGGAGADTFVWSLGDQGSPGNPAQDTVTDFGTGSDKLDLSDLLQGEEAAGGDLSDYLHFVDSGADTVIHVSSNGGYAGTYDGAATDQTITLNGVQLSGSNDNDIAQQMVNNGQLDVDS